jgi:hypothetical protein
MLMDMLSVQYVETGNEKAVPVIDTYLKKGMKGNWNVNMKEMETDHSNRRREILTPTVMKQ